MLTFVTAAPLLFVLMSKVLVLTTSQPVILDAPKNATVGRGDPPVVLTCRIMGDNIFWSVNSELYDFSNEESFRKRGITFTRPVNAGNNIITEAVSVTTTSQNNNTEVICHAAFQSRMLVTSDTATIFIANVPLRPSPQFSTVNESTIQVQWQAPFTWHDYPIINYTVEITNETSAELLASAVLGPDSLLYSLTQMTPSSCTNLTIVLYANNSLGRSPSGIVQGAFPYPPGEFLDSPNYEVTFTQLDNLPVLDINFTFPSLCPYNDATYWLDIVDENGETVYIDGQHQWDWSASGNKVIMEIREVGLQSNTHYIANITVMTRVGYSSITFLFNTINGLSLITTQSSTNIEPSSVTTQFSDDTYFSNGTYFSNATTQYPLDSVEDSERSNWTMEIVFACLGIVILMLSLGGLILCGIYTYRHSVKNNRAIDHDTQMRLCTRPMVLNPIYEGGVIYEEIPNLKPLPQDMYEKEEGYVSIETSAVLSKKDFLTTEKSNLGKKVGVTNGVEEAYTMMNPIGTLISQSREGVAAGSAIEQVEEFYSNINPVDGASAKDVVKLESAEVETEGRYVIIS